MALWFVVVLVTLISWQEAVGGAGVAHHRTAWMLVMALAAVWCSRTLALGGPREAARSVAASWWIVPAGRLVGAVSLLLPVIVALAVLLVTGRTGAPPTISFVLTSALLGATTGAVTMALTIGMGASAAASVMFLAAILGGIDPVSLRVVLGPGWAVEVVPRVWAILPLQWRADGWPDGVEGFVLVAAAWVAASLVVVGFAVAGPRWSRLLHD